MNRCEKGSSSCLTKNDCIKDCKTILKKNGVLWYLSDFIRIMFHIDHSAYSCHKVILELIFLIHIDTLDIPCI